MNQSHSGHVQTRSQAFWMVLDCCHAIAGSTSWQWGEDFHFFYQKAKQKNSNKLLFPTTVKIKRSSPTTNCTEDAYIILATIACSTRNGRRFQGLVCLVRIKRLRRSFGSVNTATAKLIAESMPWDFAIASKNSGPPPLQSWQQLVLVAQVKAFNGPTGSWHISNFGSVMAMKYPDLHNLPWIMRITSSNPLACGFSSDHWCGTCLAFQDLQWTLGYPVKRSWLLWLGELGRIPSLAQQALVPSSEQRDSQRSPFPETKLKRKNQEFARHSMPTHTIFKCAGSGNKLVKTLRNSYCLIHLNSVPFTPPHHLRNHPVCCGSPDASSRAAAARWSPRATPPGPDLHRPPRNAPHRESVKHAGRSPPNMPCSALRVGVGRSGKF